MSPRHYLYPLNPKSKQGYYFQDERGNQYPTSVEGFLDCYSNQTSAEWGFYQGINDVQEGDFIWVHFSLPISAIMAVGLVRQTERSDDKFGRHTIWIDWDWKLTKQLQKNPIPFSSHRQRVPVSVREAKGKTLRVIATWLNGNQLSQPTRRLRSVKFKEVTTQQRQGQGDFRQLLMIAYDYRCAVTGCDVRDTLQAAHIIAVSSGGQHDVKNGLLLRADIHNLFDRRLLTIDNRYRIRLHPSIRNSSTYKSLHGKKLAVIPTSKFRPSVKYLTQHRKSVK